MTQALLHSADKGNSNFSPSLYKAWLHNLPTSSHSLFWRTNLHNVKLFYRFASSVVMSRNKVCPTSWGCKNKVSWHWAQLSSRMPEWWVQSKITHLLKFDALQIVALLECQCHQLPQQIHHSQSYWRFMMICGANLLIRKRAICSWLQLFH